MYAQCVSAPRLCRRVLFDTVFGLGYVVAVLECMRAPAGETRIGAAEVSTNLSVT